MSKTSSRQIKDAYKHVEVGRNLIEEKIDDEATCMLFVLIVQEEADILTEGLFLANFEILAIMLSINA
jgi:hypothetical protein